MASAVIRPCCQSELSIVATARCFGFTVTEANDEELANYALEINKWLARQAFRAKIACSLPLCDAAKAHCLNESGSLFGKVVLQP